MKKKTFIGWIPKTYKNNLTRIKGESEFALFPAKGDMSEWSERFWPPVKVKVTIEVIE